MPKKTKGILIVLLISLSAFGLLGCKETNDHLEPCCQIASGDKISIFVATDTHHLSQNAYSDGDVFQCFVQNGDGKLLHYSDAILDAFFDDLKNKKADILILAGDLTCNGERESHLELAQKLDTVKKNGTQIFVIPGNHDIENPWARNFIGDQIENTDSITSQDFATIYEKFGYSNALSRDSDSLSYLATPSEDLWLLMLDSVKYQDNKNRSSPEKGGYLSKKTLNWIQQSSELAKANDAQLLAVMHHSLLDHSQLINKDFTVDQQSEVLKTLLGADIKLVLTGHVHLQDIKSYQREEDAKTIHDIATSCLIAYPNQYGILNYIPGLGFGYSTNRLNIDYWAKNKGIEDPNLLNFYQYSRSYFEEKSYEKYYQMLKASGDFSVEEAQIVAEAIAELNVAYFRGYRNTRLQNHTYSPGYQILKDSPDSFTKDYIMSMFDDYKSDNNRVFIP